MGTLFHIEDWKFAVAYNSWHLMVRFQTSLWKELQKITLNHVIDVMCHNLQTTSILLLMTVSLFPYHIIGPASLTYQESGYIFAKALHIEKPLFHTTLPKQKLVNFIINAVACAIVSMVHYMHIQNFLKK